MNTLMSMLLQFWAVKSWRFDNAGNRIVIIERLEVDRTSWRTLTGYVVF